MYSMIIRVSNILKLMTEFNSFFLLGPRGCGKSTLIQSLLAQQAYSTLTIDLLKVDQYRRYLAHPSLLRHEIESILDRSEKLVCVIDEVQKIPDLLDEVHSLMEQYKKRLCFALTGSSARKLKSKGANLLAGRALFKKMHPFSSREIEVRVHEDLQFGTLPRAYLEKSTRESYLHSYVETYLKEEIFQESLVRKIDSFSQFLDLAGQLNGQPINFSRLSRQIRTHTRTVQSYFEILQDTLLCTRLNGWATSHKRQLLQAPKFYFFDNGVLNAINGDLRSELKQGSFRYGNLFETFIVNEIVALNDDEDLRFKLHYWRTSTGQEVDLIVSRNITTPLVAIEVKSSDAPQLIDVETLLLFKTEYPNVKTWCLCQTPHEYKQDGIRFIPWRQGLAELRKL
jgi:uncharacterized protein